ncbi:MAG TPA: cupin-like domain-containing protein [Vicinamibacteria bacterium]|nr:cupin-like domain-containing protein [Vicinamibacteria bacterium]
MPPHFSEAERGRFLGELWPKWHRGVHHFRRPFSRPMATEADYWEVVRNWSREVRTGLRAVHPRWVDEDLLPSDADGGLRSFCRRLDDRNERDWYLYQPDGVQQWNPALWHRAVELLRPILEHVGGLPPGGIRFELFLGRYSRTVTGVHRDEADGLAFVALGPKRLYFWPRETFEDRWASPDRTHFQTGVWGFERYLDSAIVVEADAGDIIYWPRGYYHVGASPDHWSGMVTLSLWWQASAQRAVQAVVDTLLSRDGVPAAYPLDFGDLASAAASLPTALRDASGAARRALEAHWDDALSDAWARVVTGYGFLTTPAPQLVAGSRAARYFVRHPIAVVEVAGRPVVFACGHRLRALPGGDPALAGRLRGLPLGGTLDVRAALASDALPSAERDQLLAGLEAVGALVPA